MLVQNWKIFNCKLLTIILFQIFFHQGNSQRHFLASNNAVYDTIFAINAYCGLYLNVFILQNLKNSNLFLLDNTCLDYSTHSWINQCLETAIYQHEPTIQMMRMCSANIGFMINCDPHSISQLERCLLRMASSRPIQMMDYSISLGRCARNSITSRRALQCLQINYQRNRRYFSLRPVIQTGYSYRPISYIDN